MGSTATGDYDRHSDLDIMLIFHKKEVVKEYKCKIFDKYRASTSIFEGSRFEFHGKNMVSLDHVAETLSKYAADWKLAEYHSALILHDPENKFADLQKEYKWYPQDVYRAKLNWLFADASFHLYGRYATALNRNNLYYVEIIKMRIIKYLANALLLLEKQFPAPDKHLVDALHKLPSKSKEEISIINQLLESSDLDKNYKLLAKLHSSIETNLLKKNLIVKGSGKYWTFLAPQIKVDLET